MIAMDVCWLSCTVFDTKQAQPHLRRCCACMAPSFACCVCCVYCRPTGLTPSWTATTCSYSAMAVWLSRAPQHSSAQETEPLQGWCLQPKQPPASTTTEVLPLWPIARLLRFLRRVEYTNRVDQAGAFRDLWYRQLIWVLGCGMASSHQMILALCSCDWACKRRPVQFP